MLSNSEASIFTNLYIADFLPNVFLFNIFFIHYKELCGEAADSRDGSYESKKSLLKDSIHEIKSIKNNHIFWMISFSGLFRYNSFSVLLSCKYTRTYSRCGCPLLIFFDLQAYTKSAAHPSSNLNNENIHSHRILLLIFLGESMCRGPLKYLSSVME